MEIGIVKPVRIEDEMKGAYLDYAMSVITARALPDVRDGLKPVQRRILFAMHELGLRHTTAYKKSARIVGEVLGKYHPHGDAPVYEAMVRMAQDFSMRYPLVDGQGNFGSVDGDPPAAMRYTEARLAAIADEVLADIDKNTVDFTTNFDDTLKEPKVLPSKLPNLIVNGSAGIAVGMATNIPPHNLREVASALAYLIGRFGQALDSGVPFEAVWSRAFGQSVEPASLVDSLKGLRGPLAERLNALAGKSPARQSPVDRAQMLLDLLDDSLDVPPDKLMEMVKGPDFPTAGIILGAEGIKNAYATGHGRIIIRARAHTEDIRGGRIQIVVTELPFQVNKATLQEKIADLVRERRIEGISELRDESDRQGMRLVVELRRDVQPKQVLNQLFKYTAMQSAFSVNMLALVDGQPRVLTLKLVLLHYLNHRRTVITRRTEFDLEKARQRAHILEGLKIALEHLDEVIATIRRSKDAETAKAALIKNFKLSEIQAQAILDMQLRRLAALERQRILDEYTAILKLIAHLEDLLAHPAKIMYLIKDELAEVAEKHGDARRTLIVAEEAVEFTEEDLVPEQEVVVSISAKSYVRRLLADSFRLQRRGKGIRGTVAREDDPALLMTLASTRDNLLLFSNRGRAYLVKVNDLPDVSRQARGLPLSNFITVEEQERIVAALPMGKMEGRFVVLATRLGEVKRIAAADYGSARSAGIIGMAVPEGDDIIGAVATSGRQDVLLVTAAGQAIRFAEADLRPSGRNSGGVRGIRLGDKDAVVACEAVRTGAQVVVATRRGFAKRTALEEFSVQGRGGGGIRAANVGVKNGEVVAARIAGDGDELVFVAASGSILRTLVADVVETGRGALGAVAVKLKHDDRVVAVCTVPGREKGPGGTRTDGPPSDQPEQSDEGGDAGAAAPVDPPKAGRSPTKATRTGRGTSSEAAAGAGTAGGGAQRKRQEPLAGSAAGAALKTAPSKQADVMAPAKGGAVDTRASQAGAKPLSTPADTMRAWQRPPAAPASSAGVRLSTHDRLTPPASTPQAPLRGEASRTTAGAVLPGGRHQRSAAATRGEAAQSRADNWRPVPAPAAALSANEVNEKSTRGTETASRRAPGSRGVATKAEPGAPAKVQKVASGAKSTTGGGAKAQAANQAMPAKDKADKTLVGSIAAALSGGKASKGAKPAPSKPAAPAAKPKQSGLPL